MTLNGTMREPFTLATVPPAVEIEQEVGRLAQSLRPGDDTPEPIALQMITDAELAAVQVEQAADEVMRIAAAVAAEGRSLAATMRKNAEAYEAQVVAFAQFAKGVTLNIRQAATDAKTFVEAAE